MIAILVFDLAKVEINSRQFDVPLQNDLLGSAFEKLGQDKRVKVLSALSLLTPSQKEHFDLIRTTRKKYLHLWSSAHDNLSEDDKSCYSAALALVSEQIGGIADGGHFNVPAKLSAYLVERGVIESLPSGG